MRIGILTWLYNGNYGSILQAYALQNYLSKRKYNVESINYRPTVKEKVINLLKNKNSFDLLSDKWELFLLKVVGRQGKRIKDQKFDEFRTQNFNLTSCYYSPKDIKTIEGKFDIYLCGSDQIWSPMLFNPVFYFDFLKDSERLVSYACSFGVSSVPKKKEDVIASLLKRFSAISVRELEGQAIVKKLTDRDAKVVVDPTLLLSSKEWDCIASDRIFQEDYILCYFLSYNKRYWERAIEIAKGKGKKVIIIPTVKEAYHYRDEVLEGVGPEEWISLFKYASYVFTDSFHGCVFSLIYRKSFCVFKRFDDNNKKSQNSRIYTLLKQYNLEKCLVQNAESFSIPQISEVDYKDVIEKINKNADEAKKWLEEVLVEKDSEEVTINQIVKQKTCTGCGVCKIICPQKCISMRSNKRGFLEPNIIVEDCVQCGLCKKKCPISSVVGKREVINVYAACAKEIELLKQSTSGGFFGVLGKYIIENNGIVYGAAFDQSLHVRHIGISNDKELCQLQGSKYVQSEIYNILEEIACNLKQRKKVLFCGTGCQIAALNNFLGNEYENLFTVELVCHGVPSPKVFEKYINWLEKKRGEKIEEYNFRTKKKRTIGDHNQVYYKTQSKEYFDFIYKDPYYDSFLTGKTLRESCCNCQYKGNKRVADITLGDFWGIEKCIKDFPLDNGVSLVFINSLKGRELFKSISGGFIFQETTYEEAVKCNLAVAESFKGSVISFDYNDADLFSKELKSRKSLKEMIKCHIPWKWKVVLKRYI